MKLVVIESPFAGEVGRNKLYARMAVKDCLHRGEAAIASHLLYTQDGILDDALPAERDLGIRAGLAWAYWADLIAVHVDLGWSNGMKEALKLHEARGMEIEERTVPGWLEYNESVQLLRRH